MIAWTAWDRDVGASWTLVPYRAFQALSGSRSLEAIVASWAEGHLRHSCCVGAIVTWWTF
jgi:hypothetical protein